MTEYKKPGVASALLLLTIISVLLAAFGLLMLIVGKEGAALGKLQAVIVLVSGLSSSIMFAWMGAVVEYLAKISHALTVTKPAE